MPERQRPTDRAETAGPATTTGPDRSFADLDPARAGSLSFAAPASRREPQAAAGGVRVWREPLVWVGNDRSALGAGEPLPLVVSPQPCVYRKRAVAALEAAHRSWRVAYTSTSLAGSQAAVKAGLGVTVLPKDMVAAGLQVFGDNEGLPELEDTEIALYQAPGPRVRPVERLAEHIVVSLEVARAKVA